MNIDTPFMRNWNRQQAELARNERLKTWNAVLGAALICSLVIIVALCLTR